MNNLTAIALSFCLVLVAGCGKASSNPTEQLCKDFQIHAQDVNRNAPITIDFVTSLTGVSAIYSAGVCAVTYQKLVKEDLFITAIVEEARRAGQDSAFTSRESVTFFFNSDEGQRYLSNLFLQMLPADARYHGPEQVEQYHQITFDRGGIKPVRVMVR